MIIGPVSAHYFVCPRCNKPSADLETHRCKCGMRAVGVLWECHDGDFSPEIAMLSTNNTGRNYGYFN